MTKAEFYDQVEDFSDLLNFCFEYDCEHIVENIRDSDSFDDWVWDVLENNRSRWFWHDVRDMLRDIEAPSSDYFVAPEGIDSLSFGELWEEELEEYKDSVIDYLDDDGFWDDEEDGEGWVIEDDNPIENDNSDDVCWDVAVDLSVLIGV